MASAQRITVLGPAKASVGKVNDIFRHVFYVKAGEYERLIDVKDVLEERWKQETDKNLMLQFDFDPIDTF